MRVDVRGRQYPPGSTQGLTLVHSSALGKLFLCDVSGGFMEFHWQKRLRLR